MVQKSVKQITTAYKKQILVVGVAIFSVMQLSAEVSVSANLFLGRAFSANMARELLMTGPTNEQNNSDWNGFFSATAAYQRSWNQSETHGIGAYPFWSGTNSMLAGNNDSVDTNFDVYQFGLGPVTTIPTGSSISLNPVIWNPGADLLLYIGARKNETGAFFKIKSAINDMTVDPQLTEVNSVVATSYLQGELSLPTGIPSPLVANPSTTMTQAFAGGSAQGDYRPMKFGLINGKQQSGAHFSDTEMTFGYNFVCQKNYNSVSLGARVAAPTGTKPTAKYILEPLTGRGGYWGVGGYLAGNFTLWQCADERHKLFLNFMSNGMHLCTANVMRSYDLTANGHGSKYLLVADYNQGVYQSSIQNLINISTVESQSSFGFEGDAAVALSFMSGGFRLDLGYNVWGRTKENLTINPNEVDLARYAILGRQGIGLAGATYATASNACQPSATIATSVAATTTVIPSGQLPSESNNFIGDALTAANRISGADAFNTTITAQYSAVTSKIFSKIGYNWKDSECCPHIGFIGEAEFSNISNNALPQWAVALEGGISL